MSLIDKGRELAARALAKHGVPVTVTRSTWTKTTAQRAAGSKGTETVQTITGKGLLGSREAKIENGTIGQQSVATLDIQVRKGDRLVIGSRTFEIIDVVEIAPDGLTPMITRAVLQ